MKALSAFLPRVLPYALGCPEPTAVQALTDSAIAFCEESMAVRQFADVFTTVAGVREYDLEAPSQQRVARVLRVFCDGSQLQTAASADSPVDTQAGGRPGAYYVSRTDSEGMLQLYPTPDRVYSVLVEVAFSPTRSATSVQDDLFDLWVDPVVAGALYRIYSVDGQAYSDPAKAMQQMSKALMLTRKARIEAEYGRVKSTRRVQSRAF